MGLVQLQTPASTGTEPRTIPQQQEQADADASSPKSVETVGSDGGEVPGADAPLQCYRGSLQPGGQCRYTHFNGAKCRRGGRRADDMSKPQGGFCTRSGKPKDADVMSGAAEGPFCYRADGQQRGVLAKLTDAVSISCGRLLGK